MVIGTIVNAADRIERETGERPDVAYLRRTDLKAIQEAVLESHGLREHEGIMWPPEVHGIKLYPNDDLSPDAVVLGVKAKIPRTE